MATQNRERGSPAAATSGGGTAWSSAALTGATFLSGSVTAANNATFNSALTVDGNAAATSAAGDVAFVSTVNSDVANTNTFEVAALNGLADFQSTVGNAFTLNRLTVRASRTEFDNTVQVGAGGLLVEGFGGTTVLANNVTSAGAVTIDDSVTLTGAVTIDTSATPAAVRILGTVDGGQVFAINAGTSTVTVEDSIGSTTALTSLTVTANDLELNNEVRTSGALNLGGAANLTLGSDLSLVAGTTLTLDAVNGRFGLAGQGATVTLNDDIGATEMPTAVTLRSTNSFTLAAGVDVASSGLASVTTTGAGTDITLNGNVTGDAVSVAAVQDIAGATGTVTAVNGVSLDAGQNVTLTGTDLAGGTVSVSAGDDVSLTAASTVTGTGTVNLESGLAAGDDVTLAGTVSGGDLMVKAGAGSVSVSGALSAAQTLTVTGADLGLTAVLSAGTTAGIAGTGTVTLGAGSNVTADSANVTGGTLSVTGAQNNTAGATTYNGPATVTANVSALDDLTFNGALNLGADLTAGQDATLNGAVNLTGGAVTRTVTATNGDIDLNAAVDAATASTESLTLTAADGTVSAQGLGTTRRLNALVVNADALELAANVAAVTVNTTGAGLTTLVSDVTVNATGTGATAIDLGDLSGTKALTLTASGATGDIALAGGALGALTVTDGNDVTFAESFATTGAVSVTGVDGSVAVPLAGIVDVAAERARHEKELGKVRKELEGLEKRLANPEFTAKAPAGIVTDGPTR